MAEVTANLRSLRIAPRKVRVVADLVKGMDTTSAEVQLRTHIRRASDPLLKLIKSAVANARNNAQVPESEALYIKDFRVDEGRAYKRFMPRARGRASQIKKRTSHISLVLTTEPKK